MCTQNLPYSIIPKSSIKWVCRPMKQKELVLKDLENGEVPNEMLPPISYFMKYFTVEAFENMAIYTNIYAEQQNTDKWVPITASELKVFVGSHIIMGNLQFSRVRMNWEKDYRINVIADNITRDRFFELQTHFHQIKNIMLAS